MSSGMSADKDEKIERLPGVTVELVYALSGHVVKHTSNKLSHTRLYST